MPRLDKPRVDPVAIDDFDDDVIKRWQHQQVDIGKSLIKAPAQSAQYVDGSCAYAPTVMQRQLEVGLVFIRRMLDDFRTSRSEARDFIGAERIEIADDGMRHQAERARVKGAAVRADHVGQIERRKHAVKHHATLEFSVGEEKDLHVSHPLNLCFGRRV